MQNIKKENLEEKHFFFANVKVEKDKWIKKNEPYKIEVSRITKVKSGWGKYIINLREVILKKGNVIILPVGTIIERGDWSDDYTISVVSLGAGTDSVLSSHNIVFCPLSAEEDAVFNLYYELLESIFTIEGYRAELLDGLTYSMLMATFYFASKHRANLVDDNKGARLIKFFSLVSENACKERSVGFYASKLCLSPQYLCSYIKKETGESVVFWITKSIVDRAKSELGFSEKSIGDIAYELCFEDTSAFCRYFKRATGLTPSEYRQQSRP